MKPDLILIIGIALGWVCGYIHGRAKGDRKGRDAVIKEMKDDGQYWDGQRMIVMVGTVKPMLADLPSIVVTRLDETKKPQKAAPAKKLDHPFTQPVSHE